MPVTLDDLVEAIHARHLPLHIAVQLTPEVLAELWSKPHEMRRRAFNTLLGRHRRSAPAPTLDELVEATQRGPEVVPCESGQWSGEHCPSTHAYERVDVVPPHLQGTAKTLGSTRGLTTMLRVCEGCADWIAQAEVEDEN